MPRPMQVQIITKDGRQVIENCHDIDTCREHREGLARAKKFATGTGLKHDTFEDNTDLYNVEDLMAGMDLSNDFADIKEVSISHKEILERKGFKVDAFESFGDYQGDYAAIVEKDGQVGFVIIGYGSCSGCDALQAIQPWVWEPKQEEFASEAAYEESVNKFENQMAVYRDELQAYADNIERNTIFGSHEQLQEAITGADGKIKWYSKDTGFDKSKTALLNALDKAFKK